MGNTVFSALRRPAIAVAVALGLVGLALMLFAPGRSFAQAGRTAAIKQVTLTGGEENPPVTVNGIGYFSGTLTEDSLEYDLSAVAPGLTAAHLHIAAKGVNGGVVLTLFSSADGQNAFHVTGTAKKSDLSGTVKDDWAAFAAALAKGEVYVNAHSKTNPVGVMRAQLPATTLTPPSPPRTGAGLSGGDTSWPMTTVAGALLVVLAAATLSMLAVRRRRA